MDEALWRAIVDCQTTFDGQFFYGVVTTGIFCRPSCRSRTPLPENVRIFQSINEAMFAGFRACKRCRSDQHSLGPNEELVQAATAILNQRYQESLTLDALARELSISPYHLHRVFKGFMGITPADYVLDRRIRSAKDLLRTETTRSIMDVALAVGFRSASHFSTVFQRIAGHSPSNYRSLHLRRQATEEVTQ